MSTRISDAIKSLATQVKYLGVGDAGTSMGAIEFLGAQVSEHGTSIAASLAEIARAIAEAAEPRCALSAEEAMRQAPMTADFYLGEAVERIDARFGEGYARKHPELIGAFIQACAADFQAARR